MGVRNKSERREKGEESEEVRAGIGEKTRVTSLEAERARELCESTRAVQEQVKRVEACCSEEGNLNLIVIDSLSLSFLHFTSQLTFTQLTTLNQKMDGFMNLAKQVRLSLSLPHSISPLIFVFPLLLSVTGLLCLSEISKR